MEHMIVNDRNESVWDTTASKGGRTTNPMSPMKTVSSKCKSSKEAGLFKTEIPLEKILYVCNRTLPTTQSQVRWKTTVERNYGSEGKKIKIRSSCFARMDKQEL